MGLDKIQILVAQYVVIGRPIIMAYTGLYTGCNDNNVD